MLNWATSRGAVVEDIPIWSFLKKFNHYEGGTWDGKAKGKGKKWEFNIYDEEKYELGIKMPDLPHLGYYVNLYEGEFKKGEFNGFGKYSYYFDDPSVLERLERSGTEGHYIREIEGVPHKFGIYEGEFKNGQFHGNGKLMVFINNSDRGRGRDEDIASFLSKGTSLADVSDGNYAFVHRLYIISDESGDYEIRAISGYLAFIYEGEFKDGMYHGTGLYMSKHEPEKEVIVRNGDIHRSPNHALHGLQKNDVTRWEVNEEKGLVEEGPTGKHVGISQEPFASTFIVREEIKFEDGKAIDGTYYFEDGTSYSGTWLREEGKEFHELEFVRIA